MFRPLAVGVCASLLLPGCWDLSGSRVTAGAGTPRITDLAATPNPARAGDVVDISFVAWDAGGGSGGDWMVFLSEEPNVGGRLDPTRSRESLRGSPVRCSTLYTTRAPTKARIEVWVFAYGDCSGFLCEAPSNVAKASMDVEVRER